MITFDIWSSDLELSHGVISQMCLTFKEVVGLGVAQW